MTEAASEDERIAHAGAVGPAGAASVRPGPGAEVLRLRSSLLIALPFAIACVVAAVVLSALGAPVGVGLTILLVPTLAVPALAELVFRTELPAPLQLHYLAFITAGPFAGSALNVYAFIGGWDKLVHFDSGVMLSWLGLLVVRRVEESMRAPLPRWFAVAVVLATPVAFAALWEFCEFASDLVLGTVAQRGLVDTMGDMLAGAAGGLLGLAIALLARRPGTLLPLSWAGAR